MHQFCCILVVGGISQFARNVTFKKHPTIYMIDLGDKIHTQSLCNCHLRQVILAVWLASASLHATGCIYIPFTLWANLEGITPWAKWHNCSNASCVWHRHRKVWCAIYYNKTLCEFTSLKPEGMPGRCKACEPLYFSPDGDRAKSCFLVVPQLDTTCSDGNWGTSPQPPSW